MSIAFFFTLRHSCGSRYIEVGIRGFSLFKIVVDILVDNTIDSHTYNLIANYQYSGITIGLYVGIRLVVVMSKQDTQQEVAAQNELAAKIQRNLELMKKARQSESSGDYFRIQGGEKSVLQFTGDFSPEQREFQEKDSAGNVVKDKDGNVKMVKKIRYEYKVIDINNQDKGIQTWGVSSNVSKQIDGFLEEGLMTLKVSREGNDFGTKYYFIPVQNNGKKVQ
jgi:hypothetical protein